MKSVVCGILLSLSLFTSQALADDVLVRVSDSTAVESDETSVRNYDREIKRLEQDSDQITVQILDKTSGDEKNSADGVQVALVKVRK